ncbi:MAG TPA: fatty acyl-AMP ligase, partial [Pyrinomonadaceae bacterium]
MLRRRALVQPQQVAYSYVADAEADEATLTYGELDRQARAIGAALQALGAEGERALLLYPPGLDYVAAFFGCLYAGVTAVPAYPPRSPRGLPRVQAIVADARARFALGPAPLASGDGPDLAAGLQGLRWVATGSLETNAEDGWREPAVGPDSLAFLQYTSGSTGTPKGVMVSHRNLLHNSELLERSFGYTPSTRCVTWLPLYHDMGLIGGVLQPLYGGFHNTLLSPLSFLRNPARWLEVISRTEATLSGGPNFAYDLCVRKVTAEQADALDLRHWGVAFTGAEPVRAETLERFARTFAPCGFRREAFFPCYGLAEATLLVSGGPREAAPVACAVERQALAGGRVREVADGGGGAQVIVGCGEVPDGLRVVIARPET